MMIFNKAALTLFPFPVQLTTLQYRPGPPAAVKRPRRFPQRIDFLRRFCVGAQGRLTATTGGHRPAPGQS
jgi:hypothetical protein